MTPDELKAFEVLEHAELGKGISDEEIGILYAFPSTSRVAYAARATAHELSVQATGGIADIHGQVDMDGSPCPHDCRFCSLAESNTARREKEEMPRKEVFENVERYLDAGVNLISLMVTGAYDFDKYVDICAEAIKMIPDEIPVLANLDDFTLEQALKLKEIGFDSVYHVIHWGEGDITNISPDLRIKTFENARKASLSIASGVEPVDPDATAEQLCKGFRDTLKYAQPISVCSIWRYPVPGSDFEDQTPKTQIDFAFLMALTRLICGLDVPYVGSFALNGDSGAVWSTAEVGMNPRDVANRTEKEGVGKRVETERDLFRKFGWEIREGGSPLWKLT